jgi:hypothetical protein
MLTYGYKTTEQLIQTIEPAPSFEFAHVYDASLVLSIELRKGCKHIQTVLAGLGVDIATENGAYFILPNISYGG